MLRSGHTPVIKDAVGRVKRESIASMERVTLGGVEQWVVIRGHDRKNPLLLYLHGGPGGSDYAPVRRWNGALEERFTIVHWVQRGAAKSYSDRIPPASMTLEQLVADAHQLTLLLLARFRQEQVFVAGQSLGCHIGLLLAHRYPELVRAYVGVNQTLDRVQEERVSYLYALETARQLGNRKAVADLERFGPPEDGGAGNLQAILTQREWLRKFGQVTCDPKRLREWMMTVLFAPEHTWLDRVRFMKALGWSMKLLFPDYPRYNFMKQITEVKVPVYLVAGRHDHITSLDLAQKFIAQVRAPRKELFVFEQSGHIALFEEPERFNDLMINRVLKENDPAEAS